MARNNPTAVKNFRDTDIDVAPMIAAAGAIVDDIFEVCGITFTEARLKQIELWLAAHFVGTQDPTLSREKFEDRKSVV